MRYQKYKNRMAKISKVLNILYRFRIPIIATIVVSTAAALTFTGLNGTAQSVVLSQKDFQYGDDVEAFGQSTFGDADLEYSLSGKNAWTREVPVRVGTYDVRAVSTNGFGQTTYSSPVSFSISPIPFEIEMVTKVNTYGNDLVYDAPNLASGDRIDTINFNYGENYFTSNPFGENDTFKTEVSLDTSTIKIIDNENVDVTYCYDIKEQTFEVDIKKRKLNIEVENSQKQYDGKELSTEGNTFVSDSTPLASGDNISIDYNTSFSEIGTQSITDTITITNGEYDRTNFYDVHYNVNELTITPREITITTNSINRDYNGERLSKDAVSEENLLTYSLSNTVADNHTFKFNGFNSETLYKPVVNSLNSINYQILDEDGNDITDAGYYDITENFGNITINQLDITIDYKVCEPEYFNYQTLRGGFVVNGELANNDKVVAELQDGYTTDTLSTNTTLYYAYDFSIFNDNLGDVSDCYNINVPSPYGVLEIKSVPLTLTSNSIEKTYDGIPFGDTTNTPVESMLVGYADGLLDGHRVEFDFSHNNELFIENGSAKNSFNYTIYDQNDNDVSSFYDIEINVGTLTTHKRDLKVKYRSNSWVFDGEYHTAEVLEGTLPDGGTNLAETDEIVFYGTYPSVYHVGQYDNYVDFYISHNGLDVSSYYNFPSYEDMKGNLEITKRPVYIDFTMLQSRMYDGTITSITSDMVTFESGNLNLENFDIVYGFNFNEIALYQEGGYDLEIQGLTVFDKEGNDITPNFEFITKNNNEVYNQGENISLGHVDIYKRPITISTYDATKVYDSTELNSEDAASEAGETQVYTITGDSSLAENDTVQINAMSSITSVGIIENSLVYSINNPLIGDVTNSYDITTDFGNLEITSKSGLTITIDDVEDFTYDSHEHYLSLSYSLDNLQPNDIFIIDRLPLKEAGTYEPKQFFRYEIKNNVTGDDVTKSYDEITIIGNPMTIHKADLSIVMADINIDLLNEKLPTPTSIATISGLQVYDRVKLTYGKDALKEVGLGSYPTIIYDVVHYETQKSVLNNYNVTYIPGKADLSLMDVEIGFRDGATYLDYVDEIIDINEIFTPSYLFDYSLPEGYYFENLAAKADREIKEPGEYSLTFESLENLEIYRVVNGEKEYVTDKFNIIPDPTPGTLVVQKRQIIINETYFSFTYNGQYQYIPTYNLLHVDHHVEIVGYEAPINAGNYVFEIDSVDDVIIKDALGNDVTYLYDIIVNDSVYESSITMDINKVDLTIQNPTYNKIFDAESILFSDIQESCSYSLTFNNGFPQNVYLNKKGGHTLPTGDIISYKTPVMPTDYHVYSKAFEMDFTIEDKNGNDKSNNYNLSTIPGTISILPLEIKYTAKHTSHTYNGQDENYHQTIDGKSSSTDFVTFNISLLPTIVANFILSGAEGSYAVIDVYDYKVGAYSSTPTFVIMYNGQDLVAMGDIVFNSSDPYVEVEITKRNLTIRNEMNQEITLSKRNPFVKEKLIVGGLTKTDTLYINGEEYSSSKSDYDIIPNINVGSSDGIIYGADYYSLYINASCIQIINDETGEDVTHCYNLNFVWYDVIVYQ